MRGYRWLIAIWATVAVFAVITAIRSHQVGVPLRDPSGSIFRLRFALSLTLFAVLILADAVFRSRRGGFSVLKAFAEMRRRWPRERLALALSGLLAYHLIYVCYRNLKSWVAFRPDQDEALLRFDKWLFFGNSPAVLLHDLLGRDVAAHVLAVIYESFSVMVPVSFVAALVFANKIREGYVFLVAAIWIWILGVGSYYLIPSLGPFTSAAKEFVGLSHTGPTDTQAKYLASREQLLAHPEFHDSFASISAFASLHTAFTFMVLLMMHYYGFRRITQFMVVYFSAVLVSTVYLGWHFVVDLPAGMLVAYLSVLIARWTVYPRGRRTP